MMFVEILKDIKRALINAGEQKYFTASEAQIIADLSAWYSGKMNRPIDILHPKTFNEKIQWLKLFDATKQKAVLADKYACRKLIAEKIGEEHLIPLLGVYERYEDIDFTKLPDKFVLKTNHGSGTNVIVNDKTKMDHFHNRHQFARWMKTNFAFNESFELHYGYIEPKIICEQFMGYLNDYKFFCFDGEPKYVWEDVDRFTNHTRDIYDLEWNEMPFTINSFERVKKEKPQCFDEMLEIARTLCQGFPFVRVDLYEVDGTVYFGELTFTSSGGRSRFYPDEYDEIVGSWLPLPEKKPMPLQEIRKVWTKERYRGK